jgi:hypothetical protein
MRPAAILLVVLALALPRVAAADPSPLDKAAAQSLFEEGLRRMAQKDYAAACPKLEESQRLDPGMGTQYRLAECYEATGRTASAWAGFAEVADLAKAAGQGDREKLARQRAAALEPKLSRLTITAAAPGTPGLELRRRDVVVGKGEWGVALPVDPGTYAVEAKAPGKKPWSGSVTVTGEGAQASLLVPALEDAPTPVAPPAPPVAALPPPVVVSAPPPAPEPSSGGWRRTVGIVGLGVGVAGLGTGVALGFVAKNQYDGAGAHCQGSVCDASGKQTTDAARSLGDAATAVFVVGGVVAAAGVVLWLTAPASAAGAQRASLGVSCGPGSAFVEGRF